MEYARALLEGRFKRISLEHEIAEANEILLQKTNGYQIKFQNSEFFRSLKFEMLGYRKDLVKQNVMRQELTSRYHTYRTRVKYFSYYR